MLLIWGLILTASLLCATESIARLEKLPLVGSRLNVPKPAISVGLCMVSPGQMDKCFRAEVLGVQYTVAFRRKAKFRKPVVTYVHTTDPGFLSPSGKRVGDLLEVSYPQIVKAPGFEIYAGGPVGGWTAVIGFDGKVASGSRDEDRVDLETFSERSGPLRLRVTGFTAR